METEQNMFSHLPLLLICNVTCKVRQCVLSYVICHLSQNGRLQRIKYVHQVVIQTRQNYKNLQVKT